MKKINIYFVLICLGFVWGCKSTKIKSTVLPKEYKVINAHFGRMNKKYKLFYKTITHMTTKDTLANKITIGQLNYHTFKNGYPKQVDYDTIFNMKTIKYLREKFAHLERYKLDKKKINTTELKKNKKVEDLHYITMPIITEDGKFALFYTESLSFRGKLVIGGGGQLWVYKKNEKEGAWSFYSTSLLWVI